MKKIIPSLITSGLILIPSYAHADEAFDEGLRLESYPPSNEPAPADDAGMIESLSGYNVNNTSFLKNNNISVGGWIDGGITWASHSNKDESNYPISFNDQVNTFQMNQLNLFVEKSLNKADSWDFGGRVDFMFGTDSAKTQARGWDNQLLPSDVGHYDIAFPQAYAEIYAPFGNGITAKIGHFYTIIGYEVVTSPDNFFYSHAYTMLYGEPFTHTGALLNYDINNNISITGGAVMGWDNFREDPGAWSFLGGATFTTDDADTSLAISLITGNQSEHVNNGTTMYSVVLQHNFTEKLHIVLQHDYGTEDNQPADGENADWYGINSYLYYDVNDKLAAGVRGEWFRDSTGFRTGYDGSYYEITGGVNYTPTSWIKLRPELRYDWFDADGNSSPAFDGGTESDQFEIAMDMIISF